MISAFRPLFPEYICFQHVLFLMSTSKYPLVVALPHYDLYFSFIDYGGDNFSDRLDNLVFATIILQISDF